MAKRLNKNAVAGISLFFFAGLIGLSLVIINQIRHQDPSHMIALAEQYGKNGEWLLASSFYRRAFDRSREPRHLVHFGDALLNLGDVRGAIGAWREALVLEPTLVDAHRRRLETLLEYARLYGRLFDWQELNEAAEALLKLEGNKTDADTAMGHHANGLALVHQATQNPGNLDRGIEELKRAAALAPNTVEYLVDLVVQSIRHGRVTEGEQLFADYLNRFKTPGPDASKVMLTYAQYQASRRKMDEADKNFQESIRLAGDDVESSVEAMTSYATFLTRQWARLVSDPLQKGDAEPVFRKTETLLKETIERSPESYEPYMSLAFLYQAAGRNEDSLEACKKRLSRKLSRQGVDAAKNILNTFNLMIRASEACVALATSAAAKDGPEVRDRWLKQAQQYVDDARGELPVHPKLGTQSGRVKIAQGNYRAALSDLRAADEAYRTYSWIDWENKKLLARVHMELNEAGAAKEVLDQVVEHASASLGDDPSFWSLYAQVVFKNGDYERAQALTDRVLLIDPNNTDAKQLKMAILERTGRHQEAVRMTESPATQVLLAARERALAGDKDQAIDILLQGLDKAPTDVQLVATTVRELLERERKDEARTIAQKAVAAKPDDITFKKLEVLTRPDLSEANRDKAMLELIESEPDAYKRKLDLIAYYTDKKDFSKALSLMNEAEKHLITRDTPLSQQSSLAQHRALLAAKLRTASDLKDQTAMTEAKDAAAKYDVDGAGGKSILGAYHMAREEVDLAVKALREAVAAQPTDSRSLTALAQCLQSMNANEEAKGFFERAIRANPSEGAAFRGLAMLAKAKGDTEAYETALARAEKLMPNDPWVHAELLLRGEQANPNSAITRREKLFAEKPDDLQNIYRLATLYETTRDYSKADQYYEKLLKFKPDEKELFAVVAKYYRRTGRAEKALQLVTTFVNSRQKPEEKADAQVLVASHWLAENDLEATEKSLLDAAKLAETADITQSLAEFYFRPANRPKDALPWFDKAARIAQQQQLAALPNILAARINCLLHRSVNDPDTARKQIDDFIRAYPDDTRGLLLLSEWHASSGNTDEAVDTLSSYIARSPTDVSILFRRAQHYIAQGRMNNAIADLEQIKRLNPQALQLEPRVQLARLYQRSGRRDLGIRELEQLYNETTGTSNVVRAVEELTDAYMREKRLVDAERVITAEINKSKDAPNAQWFLVRGRVSVALGDYGKALNDFIRAAELNDYAQDVLLKTLDVFALAGKFPEGVAFFEQHEKPDSRTAGILARYAALLARADQKSKAVEQFRIAMELAIKDSPETVRDVTERLVTAFPPSVETINLFSANLPGGPLARANDRILIRLNRLSKRWAQAAELLQRLIESATSDKERASLWYEVAEMYHTSGEWMKAKEGYENSLRYAPQNWITLNNFAFLLSNEMGKNEEALKYAKQAVDLADNPATLRELYNALDTLGWIYVGLKQYPLAIAELSRAIRLQPDEPLTYYHLGEALRRNQQFEQATEILETGRRMASQRSEDELLKKFVTALEKNQRRDSAE